MEVIANKLTDVITRKVSIVGIKDIMFDRYPGDNNTKLDPHQKIYLEPGGSHVIGLPATNIMSLLSAHNTKSAPKRFLDKRKFKDFCDCVLSFVDIGPSFIPLLRDDKPIVFGRLDRDTQRDELSGMYIHHAVARLDKGIPNPKERPVIPLPWGLKFDLTLYPNKELKEQELINVFEKGGFGIGLGTFRGSFGKFYIEYWK